MEKNIDIIALRYHWPPGSWASLSLERAGRLFEAVEEMTKLQQQEQ